MESFEGIEIDVAISYLSRFVILREVAEQWNAKGISGSSSIRSAGITKYSLLLFNRGRLDGGPGRPLVSPNLPPCGQTGEALRDDLPCLLHQLANDLTGRLDLFDQANALAR